MTKKNKSITAQRERGREKTRRMDCETGESSSQTQKENELWDKGARTAAKPKRQKQKGDNLDILATGYPTKLASIKLAHAAEYRCAQGEHGEHFCNASRWGPFCSATHHTAPPQGPIAQQHTTAPLQRIQIGALSPSNRTKTPPQRTCVRGHVQPHSEGLRREQAFDQALLKQNLDHLLL